MIGDRGERQFKVESLKLKETARDGFNAEDIESAEPEAEGKNKEGLTAETLSTRRSERRENAESDFNTEATEAGDT